MTEPTARRPRTLALFAEWTGERYASHPALRFRTADGTWTSMAYADLRDTVRRTARALLALDLRPGDRVAILAETRPEWTHTHLACLAAGTVVVPIYPTAGEEELEWVLRDSGARAVVCEDAAQAARVEALRPRLPDLGEVLLLPVTYQGRGAVASAAPPRGRDQPHSTESRATPHPAPPVGEGPWRTLPSLPTAPLDHLLARAEAVRPEDTATLVYTSGTTGPPKGCRLTHANLGAVQDATLPLTEGGPGDRTYLYLPLAHLLAQLIQFSTLLYGGELCYFGGRVEDVVGELAEAQPTHLPSVPRLFEKVHQSVLRLAEAQEGGRARFEEAIRIGVLAADGKLPPELHEAHAAADKELFALVRAVFGGRLRWALTGGAPIAPTTLDFLRAVGIAVYEGYGMTESAGVITLNHPGAVRHGTVGRPIEGCEVRIAEDGEVLARGANVFPGYHADPAGTADALDGDGWLHTGDLGALDPDGFLTITGRKKDLIITSAGKNLTPSEVELAIERSRFVSHAVMVGDRRPYPVALITVDPAEAGGRDAAAVRALVQEAVDEANTRVSRPARIRAFAVLEEEFTIESGVLTPTLKVRRRAVVERYAQEIERLYETG
ncbi:AMP-dependent synthetase [Streptomyces sp. ERV7]|uniref:AMP-dependent synthetase/ligase n=1 Tax=Streptomyces sp. ERV7 TaxID=1322334 RepID=UPI0007F52755|nr:long-chain fatty acid--CoA ligase [Streptomyces sp. ERV7]OAR26236.1 AMP-dependent synthetase [Streptomyces sp. ERV7]